MISKQDALDRIASLKSELKEAQNYFEINYGLSESELKIIKLLKSNSPKGYTCSELSRNIRAFGRLNIETKHNLLDKMIDNGTLRCEVIPTFSGRGKSKTAYFLLEQE